MEAPNGVPHARARDAGGVGREQPGRVFDEKLDVFQLERPLHLPVPCHWEGKAANIVAAFVAAFSTSCHD